MIRYEKLRKELLVTQNEKDIKYKSKYDFRVSKKMYKKLIINRITVAIVLTSITLLAYVSENNGTAFHLSLIITLLLLIDGAIYVECCWRYKKLYPKLYFRYDKGRMEYCDGRKTHQFRANDLVYVGIETYPRNSKWRLRLMLKTSKKYTYMDLVLFEDMKILYGLLNLAASKNKY